MIRAAIFLSVQCLLVMPLPRAHAAPPNIVKAHAALIRSQMSERGAPAGEIHLALASYYAKKKMSREVSLHIEEARKRGVTAMRIDLLLGTFFRSMKRYDAAFSTLVRVLVSAEEQPYALVELWKSLYECALQAVEIKTDTSVIRQRLERLGLYFPETFEIKPTSATYSKRLTADGFNALLTGRPKHAVELFQAALDLLPSNARAHRGLGQARLRLQDFTRAAGAYLLYLELAPNAPDAVDVDRFLMDYWKAGCKDC